MNRSPLRAARLVRRLDLPVRQTWGVLMHARETRQSVLEKSFFRGFLEWFAPTFNAYTFVLARAQEYEADAEAAALAGQETGRRAPLRLVVADQVANGFWSSLHEHVKKLPEPLGDAAQQLGQALLGGQTQATGSDPIAARRTSRR